MASFNRVILVGNLTRDVELKYLQSGMAVTELGLAVNDATAGYRAYRTEALERMKFESVRADGYGFQIEMTYRLVRRGAFQINTPSRNGLSTWR